MTDLILIKPLGLVVPEHYINVFAITTEMKQVFEIAPRATATEDIYINSKAILNCGVTIELPIQLLEAANTPAKLNDLIADRAEAEAKAQADFLKREQEQEQPVRGRGRRRKVEVEEDEDEPEEIAPQTEAIFLSAIQYVVNLDKVPLLQSPAMTAFKGKHVETIENHVARFNTLRRKIEDSRRDLRTPSADSMESSLGGFSGEASRADAEGFANYENNLKQKVTEFEKQLDDQVNWFETKFLRIANEKVDVRERKFENSQIKFGENIITIDDVLAQVKTEIFEKFSLLS